MGTWNTDNVDTDHAEYIIYGALAGVTTCGFRFELSSNDANGTFVDADAEEMLDAILAALATNVDITVYGTTRTYGTKQSYTP